MEKNLCILQRPEHAPWMSFAVMMGSVFLTLGCVTSSRTAGMAQMNLQLVASLVHLHLNYLCCLLARRVIVFQCTFVYRTQIFTNNVYYTGSLCNISYFPQHT